MFLTTTGDAITPLIGPLNIYFPLGDYVVSHHSWMKNLGSSMSSSIRAFDNGQVPSDMTRFTEASMRMIGTVLVDEKNAVRREPSDNLLSQYYQTEMQITNVDQVRRLLLLYPTSTID